MTRNWLGPLLAVAAIVAVIVLARYFFSAGSMNTQDLPYEHARGNPLALRELKRRPYDPLLSAAFRRMAADPDPKVRQAALLYLAKGTEPAEEAVLIAALSDQVPEVRATAATACDQRRLKRAVGPLIALLEDPSVEVMAAAQAALMRITGRRHYMNRSEWEEWWRLHREGFD